jgi:hypothetical protein
MLEKPIKLNANGTKTEIIILKTALPLSREQLVAEM